MIIKISNLSDGVHKFNFDESVEKIRLGEEFTGSINVDVELNKVPLQVILNVHLSVKTIFQCDRCAADYSPVLSNSYQMVYFFGKDTDGDDSLNVTYLNAEADKIDISSDVRDYSILALPMKKLCKEDCKGLCYKCGKNLNEEECGCTENIDPRWQPLIDIKKN
ncbi:MAG: DUF177 domain-containing protein [Ignavibacteriaceae bacterium]|nr:DUF177 domain-containing protein [Ignavibacteriaceae bacterium]